MDLRALLFLVGLKNCLYITQPKKLLNLLLPYILNMCTESRGGKRRNSHCWQTQSNLHWCFHWLAIHVKQENIIQKSVAVQIMGLQIPIALSTPSRAINYLQCLACHDGFSCNQQYLGFLHLTSEEHILYGSMVYRACILLVLYGSMVYRACILLVNRIM